MGRRKIKVRREGNLGNSLADKLEAGEPIEGMKGFIRITDDFNDNDDESNVNAVYIAVKAVGLDAGDCGLKVLVEVISGKGIIPISPCRWRDNVADLEAERDKERRIKIAVTEHHAIVNEPHYLSSKRKALAEYITNRLTQEQSKEFFDNLKDEYKGATSLEKITLGDISSLTKTVVLIANNLLTSDVDYYSFRSY